MEIKGTSELSQQYAEGFLLTIGHAIQTLPPFLQQYNRCGNPWGQA